VTLCRALTFLSDCYCLCYNKVMPKHLIPVLSLLSAVILLLMLNFTTPTGVGPFGVLVFFAACYLVVLGIATAVVGLFTKILGKQMGKKNYLYAAIIAFGPIMVLLVQSLGALSPFTVGVIALLVFLVCFLVSKSSSQS